VQKEVERQNAAEEEAARRTVEKAIQEARSWSVRRDRAADGLDHSRTASAPAIPNGQSEQESQPNLAQ
jgi:hypothetical protein